MFFKVFCIFSLMDDFYEFVFLPRHSFTMLCFLFLRYNNQYYVLCILREKDKFLLQLILKLNTATTRFRLIFFFCMFYFCNCYNKKIENRIISCTRRKLRERENCCPNILIISRIRKRVGDLLLYEESSVGIFFLDLGCFAQEASLQRE